ncbi:hypothetical protein IMZ08_13960 [Bacillus luteolus]|uniref:Uncharacterized protein n=1 Tax=Litchfieldia luteola TaxID=682179 RepID=A0ABR9QL06_9BACI|nr:hypothetical protein [Cytobacillus luteolus]MBE4909167.1 hypothetical protein [Cytobacillus luteolus]MBP1940380.1 hypothetical protein [Cytobacillus luteolus]
MNNNNYSKYFRIFIVIALAASLILNFNLLVSLDRVEHQVNSLSHNQHNILSDVNSQAGQIQNIMNEFLNEQSWISRIHMEFDQSEAEDGKAAATFEWQVKELQSNSEVTFNYVYGPGEDFITLPAKEIQQGLFQVRIPIEVEVKPLWEVGVITTTGSSMEEESKQKFEDRMEERDQQHRLKYFVSVTYDDMVKSSEIHTEHLGHFGTSKYGIIRSDIHIHQDNISLTLYNEFMMEPSDHVVNAYLVKYEGDKLIEEEEMESLGPEEEWPRHFHVNQIEKYENMRLVIKVEYSNGEIFEKEVLID